MSAESQETKIAVLENNQKTMSKEITEIKDIVLKFDEKLDKALEKKANKWTESVIVWFIATVAAATLTFIIKYIIKV